MTPVTLRTHDHYTGGERSLSGAVRAPAHTTAPERGPLARPRPGADASTGLEAFRRSAAARASLLLIGLHAGLLAGVPSALAAGPRPAVVLLPLERIGDAVPSLVAGRMDETYRQTASADPAVAIVPGRAANGAPAPAPSGGGRVASDKGVQAGLEALNIGQGLLGQAKGAAASKAFEKAIGAFQKRIADLEDLEPLVEALVGLAAARYAVGNTKGGDDALSQAVTMRPNLVPSPEASSAALTAALDRLRAESATPTGDLDIGCATPGCTVLVDGIAQAPGSALVSGLSRGLHWIRATAPGHKPWLARVMAPAAGKTAKLVATLRKGNATSVTIGGASAPPPSVGLIGGSPEVLGVFAREGAYGAPYLAQAGAVAQASGATHVLANVTNRVGSNYVVVAYLYSAADGQVAEVVSTPVALDASDLSLRMQQHQAAIRDAAMRFPASRVVRVTPPAVYSAARVAVAPTPVPVPAAPPSAFTPAPVAPPVTAGTAAPPALPGMPVFTPAPVAPTPAPTFTPPGIPAATAPTAPAAPPALPGFNPTPVAPTPSAAVAPPPQFNPLAPLPSRPAPTPFTAPPPVVVDEDDGDDEPVYKKWWLWTIVGVAVVGGSVAAGILLAPADAAPDRFSATVTFE